MPDAFSFGYPWLPVARVALNHPFTLRLLFCVCFAVDYGGAGADDPFARLVPL